MAYSISSIFLILIIIYIIINFAYSFKIKKIAALDCILLSILYSYRIFLGIIIANLTVSVWLISFSFFIFLALAYIKRYSELYSLKNFKIEKTKGRGYQVKDMPVVIGMSIASGFLSVLVLDIYFSSEEIRQTFKTIWISYICIPLLLYIGSLVLWLIVLKKIEVSQAYPLSAMGFIFTSTFAFFFLHETVCTAKIIGLMLIVVGIIFISRS